MRSYIFPDVDNGGNVDTSGEEMSLDKVPQERHDPRILGVRPRERGRPREGVANDPGDRREGCVSRG